VDVRILSKVRLFAHHVLLESILLVVTFVKRVLLVVSLLLLQVPLDALNVEQANL
jgi:hypothetical protein